MRKLLTAFAALCCSISLLAVPAYRGVIKFTQPDGSTIMIRLHGDEFCHWVTDASSGQLLEKDADGYYKPASETGLIARRNAAQVRRSSANAARRLSPAKSSVAIGEKHFLVVILYFSDSNFTVSNPRQAFSNLMNQEGYSGNGATGSVRDYYYDNSHGLFTPVFDVAGPYKVSKAASYYAGSDGLDKPEEAFYEACSKANSDIDFSNYDSDGDGIVDMIFFYYAGHNMAEGADGTIWPHQYSFQSTDYYNNKFDGKKLGSYACTSELKGASGSNMCGIGTACHEFGHAMGLPDFYDTDYDDNGQCAGMFDFSTMDSGSYNNEGRTPPFFTTLERVLLGWISEADAYREFTSSGTYTVGSVDNNVAYRTFTDQEGEYFVYECRGSNGWDAYLGGHGMTVTHVDKSSRKVKILNSNGDSESISASTLWSDWDSYNAINENGTHPCCYIVPSYDQSNLLYGHSWSSAGEFYYYDSSYSDRLAFPGRSNKVTTYTATSWNGVDSEIKLSNISYNGSNQVTLYATVPSYTLNYNVIANPGNGVYSAGSSFELALVESTAQPVSSVSWFLDDEPVSGASVVLTAGSHIIEAHLTLASGSEQVLELSLVAE